MLSFFRRKVKLPDGRILRRHMTRAEVELLLGPGEPDPINATRKVLVEWWYHEVGGRRLKLFYRNRLLEQVYFL